MDGGRMVDLTTFEPGQSVEIPASPKVRPRVRLPVTIAGALNLAAVNKLQDELEQARVQLMALRDFKAEIEASPNTRRETQWLPSIQSQSNVQGMDYGDEEPISVHSFIHGCSKDYGSGSDGEDLPRRESIGQSLPERQAGTLSLNSHPKASAQGPLEAIKESCTGKKGQWAEMPVDNRLMEEDWQALSEAQALYLFQHHPKIVDLVNEKVQVERQIVLALKGVEMKEPEVLAFLDENPKIKSVVRCNVRRLTDAEVAKARDAWKAEVRAEYEAQLATAAKQLEESERSATFAEKAFELKKQISDERLKNHYDHKLVAALREAEKSQETAVLREKEAKVERASAMTDDGKGRDEQVAEAKGSVTLLEGQMGYVKEMASFRPNVKISTLWEEIEQIDWSSKNLQQIVEQEEDQEEEQRNDEAKKGRAATHPESKHIKNLDLANIHPQRDHGTVQSPERRVELNGVSAPRGPSALRQVADNSKPASQPDIYSPQTVVRPDSSTNRQSRSPQHIPARHRDFSRSPLRRPGADLFSPHQQTPSPYGDRGWEVGRGVKRHYDDDYGNERYAKKSRAYYR